MATYFDASSYGGTNASWSHTCGTKPNRLLLVGVVDQTTDIAPSVTYNGVSMTLIDKSYMPSFRWIYYFYLLNPASGANTVAITGSGAARGIAASYQYIKQAAPNVYGNNGVTSSPVNVSLTTTVANCLLTSFASASYQLTAGGTNTTLRGNWLNVLVVGDSDVVMSTTGTYNQGFTGAGPTFAIVGAGWEVLVGPEGIKKVTDVDKLSIKSYHGLAIEDTKTIDGIS